MGQLAGKIAIVTGGAKGIGAAIVKRYVEEGARLVIADIDEEAGQALATTCGGNAIYAPSWMSRTKLR